MDNSTVLSLLGQFYYTADLVYADPADMMERWHELYSEVHAKARGPAPALVMVDSLLCAGHYALGLMALHRIIAHPAIPRM